MASTEQDVSSADKKRLDAIIDVQSVLELGVPVLLLSPESLDAAAQAGPAGPRDADGPVARTAVSLGLDVAALRLFSTEAYLVQGALGAGYLPDPA